MQSHPRIGLDIEGLDTNQRHSAWETQDHCPGDHVVPALFLLVPRNPEETEEKDES